MNIIRTLFYLLVFLLPVQIGRHFFFDFSLIAGVRSDYLAPTVYLTDCVALLIIGLWIVRAIKNVSFIGPWKLACLRRQVIGILFTCYLLFTSVFVADNPWGAVYRAARIVEGLLVTYVVLQSRPRWSQISLALSGAVAWVSGLAIAQYLLQQSVGGWAWFVGERTFTVSTPGIATIGVGGEKILRAYGSFPHPNVLGGFLAIALAILVFRLHSLRKVSGTYLLVWYSLAWFFGAVALGFTWSRTSWIVAMLGLGMTGRYGLFFRQWAREKKGGYLLVVISIIVSGVLPLYWAVTDPSLQERTRLTTHAVERIQSSPLIGSGLNNMFPPSAPFQPVHHLFLLWWAETGLIGVGLAGIFLFLLFQTSLRTSLVAFVVLCQWVALGLFDHYLVTLPQGILLTVLVICLVFLPQTSYTDKTDEAT